VQVLRKVNAETVARPGFEAILGVLRIGHLADGTPVHGAAVVNEDRLYRRAGDDERFVEALTFEEGRIFADARGEKDLYSDSAEVQGLMGRGLQRLRSARSADACCSLTGREPRRASRSAVRGRSAGQRIG
jgi:hypothetical protein